MLLGSFGMPPAASSDVEETDGHKHFQGAIIAFSSQGMPVRNMRGALELSVI